MELPILNLCKTYAVREKSNSHSEFKLSSSMLLNIFLRIKNKNIVYNSISVVLYGIWIYNIKKIRNLTRDK